MKEECSGRDLRAHDPPTDQNRHFNKMNNDLCSIQIWETLLNTLPSQLHS